MMAQMGLNNAYAGRGTRGFRPVLTTRQGSDVYKHLLFRAGSILATEPGGIVGLTTTDVIGLGMGRRAAPYELADDGAALIVGSTLYIAQTTKRYEEARTIIKKVLCTH